MGAMARLDYDELNATIRYVMFSAFAAEPGALGYDEEARAAVVDQTATFLKRHEDTGVVVRGIYDVAGMRADADFMFWTHAERVESLQASTATSAAPRRWAGQQTGVEQRRPAPPRGVQQEPRAGVPGR